MQLEYVGKNVRYVGVMQRKNPRNLYKDPIETLSEHEGVHVWTEIP